MHARDDRWRKTDGAHYTITTLPMVLSSEACQDARYLSVLQFSGRERQPQVGLRETFLPTPKNLYALASDRLIHVYRNCSTFIVVDAYDWKFVLIPTPSGANGSNTDEFLWIQTQIATSVFLGALFIFSGSIVLVHVDHQI